MDALKKRMIIRFAPYHPNKMDVLPKTFLKIIHATNGYCGIQIRPSSSSDDLCIRFCIYPSSTFGPNTRKH